MIDLAPTQAQLLATWERGASQRMGTRAMALLACATPGTSDSDRSLLSVGRRDSALLDLRERLFGSRFTGITSCPSCGEEVELTFSAAELRQHNARFDSAAVQLDGIEVEVRLPNGGDLVAIETSCDVTAARETLLARCLLRASRDGQAIEVADLPVPVIEASIARMAELDPQADVALDVQCPSCMHAWLEPFDIVTFLWSELAIWARRLLIDVHLIASTYGWGEREILSLTPVRRGVYLDLLR